MRAMFGTILPLPPQCHLIFPTPQCHSPIWARLYQSPLLSHSVDKYLLPPSLRPKRRKVERVSLPLWGEETPNRIWESHRLTKWIRLLLSSANLGVLGHYLIRWPLYQSWVDADVINAEPFFRPPFLSTIRKMLLLEEEPSLLRSPREYSISVAVHPTPLFFLGDTYYSET